MVTMYEVEQQLRRSEYRIMRNTAFTVKGAGVSYKMFNKNILPL